MTELSGAVREAEEAVSSASAATPAEATPPAPGVTAAATIAKTEALPTLSQIARRGGQWRRTAAYLTATETHSFAFSIAAHALLSFFPFVVLLLAVSRNLLHSAALYRGVLTLLDYYLPVSDATSEHSRTFIISNLRLIVEQHYHRTEALSLLILLVTSAGIFSPLEVALNRLWGAARNRTYLKNWSVSFGLALACGILGMLSASFTALTESYATRLARFLMRRSPMDLVQLHQSVDRLSVLLIRAGALPVTIAVFFLIYWRLPNLKISPHRVLPAAIAAGVLWEISKYVYILLLPWLNFHVLYGPFAISVSLLMWAYVSALILLVASKIAAERG